MDLNSLTLSSRTTSTPPSFHELREAGIKQIIRFGQKLWTDYNGHDPGITTLEVLCYAITDLAYRTSFPIQDLLANPEDQPGKKQFFSAAEILTCNPVTPRDLKKLMIDLDGVKNAWFLKVGAKKQNICRVYSIQQNSEAFVKIADIVSKLSSKDENIDPVVPSDKEILIDKILSEVVVALPKPRFREQLCDLIITPKPVPVYRLRPDLAKIEQLLKLLCGFVPALESPAVSTQPTYQTVLSRLEKKGQDAMIHFKTTLEETMAETVVNREGVPVFGTLDFPENLNPLDFKDQIEALFQAFQYNITDLSDKLQTVNQDVINFICRFTSQVKIQVETVDSPITLDTLKATPEGFLTELATLITEELGFENLDDELDAFWKALLKNLLFSTVRGYRIVEKERLNFLNTILADLASAEIPSGCSVEKLREDVLTYLNEKKFEGSEDLHKDEWQAIVHLLFSVFPPLSRVEYHSNHKMLSDAQALNGLYHVLLELEDHVSPDDSVRKNDIERLASKTLHAHRSLCEEVECIDFVGVKHLKLCTDLQVADGVDENEIVAQILYRVQGFLTPEVRFYSLSEMLHKGKTYDEIFQGVVLKNGFLDDNELDRAVLRRVIYKSDVSQIILGIPGVLGIRSLDMQLCQDGKVIENLRLDQGSEWCLDICGLNHDDAEAPCLYKPVIQLDCIDFQSDIKIRKREFPIPLDLQDIKERLDLIRQLNRRPVVDVSRDIEIPGGTYRDLDKFFSVQNDFPLVYRVGPGEMPDSIPAKHKGQIKQFKAFLTFFDQILGNYLASLNQVKHVLAVHQDPEEKVFFYQNLREIIPGIAELLEDFYQIKDTVLDKLNHILEPDQIGLLGALASLGPQPELAFIDAIKQILPSLSLDDQPNKALEDMLLSETGHEKFQVSRGLIAALGNRITNNQRSKLTELVGTPPLAQGLYLPQVLAILNDQDWDTGFILRCANQEIHFLITSDLLTALEEKLLPWQLEKMGELVDRSFPERNSFLAAIKAALYTYILNEELQAIVLQHGQLHLYKLTRDLLPKLEDKLSKQQIELLHPLLNTGPSEEAPFLERIREALGDSLALTEEQKRNLLACAIKEGYQVNDALIEVLEDGLDDQQKAALTALKDAPLLEEEAFLAELRKIIDKGEWDTELILRYAQWKRQYSINAAVLDQLSGQLNANQIENLEALTGHVFHSKSSFLKAVKEAIRSFQLDAEIEKILLENTRIQLYRCTDEFILKVQSYFSAEQLDELRPLKNQPLLDAAGFIERIQDVLSIEQADPQLEKFIMDSALLKKYQVNALLIEGFEERLTQPQLEALEAMLIEPFLPQQAFLNRVIQILNNREWDTDVILRNSYREGHYQITEAVLAKLEDTQAIWQIENLRELLDQTFHSRTAYIKAIREAVIMRYFLLKEALVPKAYEERLEELVNDNINRFKIRNKILDHLIARFGEQFTDFALSLYQREDIIACKEVRIRRRDELLPCKLDFLSSIPVISSQRGKGMNFRAKDCGDPAQFWDSENVSGLRKRVSKILCLENSVRRQLTCNPEVEVIRNDDEDRKIFRFVIIDAGKSPGDTDATIYLTGAKDYTRRAQAQKDREQILQSLLNGNRKLADDSTVLAVEFRDEFNDYVLLLKSFRGTPIAESRPFAVESDAIKLREELMSKVFPEPCKEELSREGFHVVEHILLRPFTKDIRTFKPFQFSDDCTISDPYSFWISVVAPLNWPRFKSPNAKDFFEQIVRKETPAHIGINFLWLTPEDMYHFENAFRNWLYDEGRRDSDECQIEQSISRLVEVLENGLHKQLSSS